jgi:NitT/TauT family transport system substrate-binding protein
MQFARIFAKGVTGAAALAFLLACAGPSRAEPVKIRIGWIVSPASLIPIMFAKPGIAKHDGTSYTLEPIHFQGSNLQITALQSGDLDIATLGFSSFSVAVENAGIKDLRIIADEIQDGVSGWGGADFMVLKDGPIKTVDDLKGKVLATNVIGGGVDTIMKAMLFKHHLLEKRDFTEIEAAFPNMNAVLLEHKADLVTAAHPFEDDPGFQAKARRLFNTRDAMGKVELSFWTARTGFIAKNRAALTDLLEDYVRAYHWFLDPANRTAAIQVASTFTKVPAKAFEGWLFTPQKDFYRDPNATPDLAAISSDIHAQKELGLVKADLDAKSYADLSLLETAIKRVK